MEQLIKKSLTRAQICEEVRPGPSSIIIFGASGDLTFRKLIPSIFALFKKRVATETILPVGGVARTKYTDEEYRNEIKRWLLNENEALNSVLSFIERIFYISGNYDDDSLYKLLQEKLNSLDKMFETQQNHIFI